MTITRAGAAPESEWWTRLRPLIVGAASALLLLGWTCAGEPVTPQGCAEHPLYPAIQESPDGRLPVIASLLVLEDEELGSVQDLVLDDLAGTDFTLHRRLRHTPILALRVGEDAFCRLVANDRVTGVELDELARPQG